MRRVIAAVTAAALCAGILAACADPKGFSDSERLSGGYKRSSDITKTSNYADGALEPPDSYTGYTNGAAVFALKQLRARYKDGESFAFSPASTALQLDLIANAASSDARQEIQLALGGLGMDDLNACSSYFKSRLESVGSQKDECVSVEGALLADDEIDIKSAFLQNNADYLGYDVFRYDFDGDHAADKLNGYLKTEDCGIDPESGTIAAVGSVSVSDPWLGTEPSAGEIKPGAEKESAGKQSFSLKGKLLKSGKATGIMAYTQNAPLKLLLVMPNDNLSLGEYVKGFDLSELEELLGSIDITKDAAASVPCFTIERGKAAEPLSDVLTKAGLYTLFSDKANFAGLSYTKNVRLSGMYELTPGFSLSPGGINTEAKPSAQAEQSTDLTLDRPFLFLLLDNESELPVIAGAYQ